jgi:hypothetical protein
MKVVVTLDADLLLLLLLLLFYRIMYYTAGWQDDIME